MGIMFPFPWRLRPRNQHDDWALPKQGFNPFNLWHFAWNGYIVSLEANFACLYSPPLPFYFRRRFFETPCFKRQLRPMPDAASAPVVPNAPSRCSQTGLLDEKKINSGSLNTGGFDETAAARGQAPAKPQVLGRSNTQLSPRLARRHWRCLSLGSTSQVRAAASSSSPSSLASLSPSHSPATTVLSPLAFPHNYKQAAHRETSVPRSLVFQSWFFLGYAQNIPSKHTANRVSVIDLPASILVSLEKCRGLSCSPARTASHRSATSFVSPKLAAPPLHAAENVDTTPRCPSPSSHRHCPLTWRTSWFSSSALSSSYNMARLCWNQVTSLIASIAFLFAFQVSGCNIKHSRSRPIHYSP